MPAPTNERQALEREREELPTHAANYRLELDATPQESKERRERLEWLFGGCRGGWLRLSRGWPALNGGVLEVGEEPMTARKLAETDAQIQTLKRHVSEECVAIASSIDTIPPGLVSREMRDRWLRALRQAMRAVALVEERLGADPTVEASATSA
jgi:hypothetical protein